MKLNQENKHQIKIECKFRCFYCGKKKPAVLLHIDHIVARKNGGSTRRENLTAACNICNSTKSSMNFEQFFNFCAKRYEEHRSMSLYFLRIIRRLTILMEVKR